MSIGKLRRPGLPFFGVAANVTTSQQVSIGRTIEEITLALGGTFTKATHVLMVRARANGKNVVEASGAQLDAINAYRGRTQAAGYLPIPFADYCMEDEFSQEVGAFDTSPGNVENMTVEMDIGAATGPTLRSIVTESAAQRSPSGNAVPYAGLISKILRYPFNVSTGGDLIIPVPFGPVSGAIIKRAHIFSSLATRVQVKQDGVAVYDQLLADANDQAVRYGRAPQANVFHVDFVGPGHIGEALDTRDARAIEWTVSFSAAASGFMVVEYIDSLLNL